MGGRKHIHVATVTKVSQNIVISLLPCGYTLGRNHINVTIVVRSYQVNKVLENKFLYTYFSSDLQVVGTKSFGQVLAIKISNHFCKILWEPLKNGSFLPKLFF